MTFKCINLTLTAQSTACFNLFIGVGKNKLSLGTLEFDTLGNSDLAGNVNRPFAVVQKG